MWGILEFLPDATLDALRQRERDLINQLKPNLNILKGEKIGGGVQNGRSKAIVAIKVSTLERKEFLSTNACSAFFQIARNAIRRAINKKCLLKGFALFYRDNPIPISDFNPAYNPCKPVIVQEIATGIKTEFHSVTACSKHFGVQISTVAQDIKHKFKFLKDYFVYYK